MCNFFPQNLITMKENTCQNFSALTPPTFEAGIPFVLRSWWVWGYPAQDRQQHAYSLPKRPGAPPTPAVTYNNPECLQTVPVVLQWGWKTRSKITQLRTIDAYQHSYVTNSVQLYCLILKTKHATSRHAAKMHLGNALRSSAFQSIEDGV